MKIQDCFLFKFDEQQKLESESKESNRKQALVIQRLIKIYTCGKVRECVERGG